MPKARDTKEKLKKVAYVVSLVDVLRSKYANDYEKVCKVLQAEARGATKKKGFGSS